MGQHSDTEQGGTDAGGPSLVLPGYRPPRDPARALKVGPHGMPREEVETIQRERLIDAFVQIVGDQGYEAAGVKAICARAGVGLNTFYALFESKEQLFLSAYDAGAELLFAHIRSHSLAGDDSWERQVELGLDSFLQAMADNPLYARFCTVEVQKAGPEVQERVVRMFETAFAFLGKAQIASAEDLPSEHLGPLIIGGVYTRIYFYIRAGRTAELPDLLPALTAFVLSAFTGARNGGG
jgi:AcrR family transcriptional regulator